MGRKNKAVGFKSNKGKSTRNNKEIAHKILQFYLKYPNKPLNHKQLSSGLQFTSPRQKDHMLKVLGQLAADEFLIQESPGKFRLNIDKGAAVGVIDFASSGSAFVRVDGFEQDVYVPRGETKNALQNDLVKLIIHSKEGSRPEGTIIEVIQRNRMQYVGVFQMGAGEKFGFVNIKQNTLHVDIHIAYEEINGAKDGDKVVVDIIEWPDGENNPTGSIVDILGTPGEHNVEIHAILAEYGLPYEFPDEVEEIAAQIDTTIHDEEIARRRDMRQVTTLTIDPHDAKDLDDALSIQKLENGNWEIGIHIADVSHYMQPDSILDNEAYARATSVYLVDRVVPMLPEVLSNNVCSLNPNEAKLTFSAVFEMDEDANIHNQWFGRTVIESNRRFSYEDAQAIIEGGEGELQQEILQMDKLAKIMRNRRTQDGAVLFDKLEVRFHLDEKGDPIGVYLKQSKEANHLIEEFMLLANRKVSEFVSVDKNKRETNKTFVYRVHDDPDPAKLESLRSFIKQFGYELKLGNRKETTAALNQLLKDVKGKGEETMIETLAMRSMSKAIYSTENIGHYGLAFDHYSHFTSPIRRYPDVMAHRLLQHYLDGGKSPNRAVYEDKCEHSSQRERLAADAERDSIKYTQVKYMAKFEGEEFYGLISGVTEWGIYVEIPETKAEGLIRLKNIMDDHYVFDQKNYAIVGQRSKKTYQLGDQVRIKVTGTDLEKKQIDFELVG